MKGLELIDTECWLNDCFAGNAVNTSSKAALISAAAYSLGYAGYGPFGNAPGFLDGLSRDNPAAWFNLSSTLFAIDPPGWEGLLLATDASQPCSIGGFYEIANVSRLCNIDAIKRQIACKEKERGHTRRKFDMFCLAVQQMHRTLKDSLRRPAC